MIYLFKTLVSKSISIYKHPALGAKKWMPGSKTFSNLPSRSMTQAICCGTTTTPTWKRGAAFDRFSGLPSPVRALNERLRRWRGPRRRARGRMAQLKGAEIGGGSGGVQNRGPKRFPSIRMPGEAIKAGKLLRSHLQAASRRIQAAASRRRTSAALLAAAWACHVWLNRGKAAETRVGRSSSNATAPKITNHHKPQSQAFPPDAPRSGLLCKP